MSLNDSQQSSCISCRTVSTFLGFELMEGHPDLSSSSEWCSASLEVPVPLGTPCTTRSIISICKLYHCKSLRSKFAEFHAEFDVCSLLQFHVHAEIADVQAHVVTNTLVLYNFQCSQSDTTWHTEWRRSLLPTAAHAFTYCHRLVIYGTSLGTFWYTYVTLTLKYPTLCPQSI
jgi:hypothetical protein